VVWTVNQVSEMRRMVKLGVDGITTDFSDKAMKGEGGGLKPET
jgi:glycerophosphoryl diester phosphodiesterase